MSRDGLQPNPEEQGLERPVACPTAKWASSPALCPNGREFDPSEPSSQHQTRPEVELSLRRCRLRGRKQSSIDVDVDINVYVIGLPVRFLSWDLLGWNMGRPVLPWASSPTGSCRLQQQGGGGCSRDDAPRSTAQRSAAAERANVGINLGSNPTPTSADAILGSHAPLRVPLPCAHLHSILASGTWPTTA